MKPVSDLAPLDMRMDMRIDSLRAAYASGALTPAEVVARVIAQAQTMSDYAIWIHPPDAATVQPYLEALANKDPHQHPLWGIPFAIKDNIDLAGVPTTAACEAFAYVPAESAPAVQRLIEAGAIPLGKTNLDQFATGLNGTRSPYGVCRNAFNPAYISGGSSSGSAVAVALGLASFSLGTDTAGSGRVPACFNNVVGLKPSRGLISTQGVVPACASLDCVSVFALCSDDANQVLAVAEAVVAGDGYGRPNPDYNRADRYGYREGRLNAAVIAPDQLQFFGSEAYHEAYQRSLALLSEQGFCLHEIDYTPFQEAAELLYQGPWVSERFLVIESLLASNPEAVHPVVRDIIASGEPMLATDLFRAQHRLAQLKQQCEQQLRDVDVLMTPTAGCCFTVEAMLQHPVEHNTALGYYTNFMNLLDLSAVTVPTAFDRTGLPFGLTLVGPAMADRALLSIANRIQQATGLTLGTSDVTVAPQREPAVGKPGMIEVLVCGAHLSGQPLNHQLTGRDATLVASTRTAPVYRLYALAGGPPYRPGLVYDPHQGCAIEVEVWAVPEARFGSFVAGIPAPLGIGQVQLESGRSVCGFICEPRGLDGATDITRFGGWRGFLAASSSAG